MVLIDKQERRRGVPLTPVCAIGASAGGVRALQQFFGKIDDDLGLAYVVIMHLSPEHDSILSEILADRTSMPVRQIGEAPTLEANAIYVIAPNRELFIDGNGIQSRPFTEPRGRRAPIDLFFQSVAAGRGDGMAVVLSGAGSDGAIGVRKIKEAGGVIFVQDPNDAEFAMMPRSAIASGVADFVEPIDKMVERIAEVAQSKKALARIGEHEAEEDLRRILSFLHARTGHDFSGYKRATVLRRVTRRMQVTRMSGLGAYATYLRENPEEAQDLFGDLLISVTAFFRDPMAFDALNREVVKPLFDAIRSEQKVRVWSVGCATGEEAYSLAILMLEEAERRQVNPAIQIFATDLDEGALATAREGRYPKSIVTDVSDERLSRFFVDDGAHYRIRKEVRDTVLFAHHSALKDPPFMHIDLITCRNLLIYLERDMQRQLLGLFHYALKPRAHMFLGSAESIDTRPELFTPCDREARVYMAKPRADHRAGMLTTQLPRDHHQALTPLPRATPEGREKPFVAPSTSHKQALEETAPPSVLVDEEHRILNLSRSAGRYIRPPEGPLSNSLPDIVSPELRAELRRALHRALDAREPTLTLPVSVIVDGVARRIVMHVSNHLPDERTAPQALVVFMDAGPVSEVSAVMDDPSPGLEHLRRMEEELRTTQERLSASRKEHEGAIQELRIANEELQSINEEYRSTAEELETSKEELQSINEELSTVNSELTSKLDAIASAHSDLQNLINATEIGTLFLDTKLRIKMLTPAVEQLFSVTDNDIGRPISDFTHKLIYDGLEQDAAKVLRDLAPVEAEVATRTNGWLMMRLRPYRTVDDRIEGVVLSFVDISARRAAEDQLRRSEERYRSLFEAMDEGYILADAIHSGSGGVLMIRDANPAARRLLKTDLSDREVAKKDVALRAEWWDLSQRVLQTGESERVEVWDDTVDLWFEVGASCVGDNRIAILFQDITDRKRHADERELLVGELNHRVKNMLAVVQSISRQTLRSTDHAEAFTEAFNKRLEALARAHNILTQDHWRGADLRQLATITLESFSTEAGRKFIIEGPHVIISPNATISVTMALHELATNAIKYGALSTETGTVSLRWWLDDGVDKPLFNFKWNEMGGPEVLPPTRKGFGGRLFKGVARELGGSVDVDYAPEGFSCIFLLPAEGMIRDGNA